MNLSQKKEEEEEEEEVNPSKVHHSLSPMTRLAKETAKKNTHTHTQQGALPFTLKSILMQKKNYGNSNISQCKNIIFKKILLKKPKSFKKS
jgi:hypothetical protein